jgi:DNA replication and repair protein RecF
MAFVSSLSLQAFRSYEQLSLRNLSANLIILHGANGAGKTNVLEALSFLVPGRGLRGAMNSDIQSRSATHPWAVAAQLENGYGGIAIGTGMDAIADKRVVRVQGETMKSQAALAEYLSCVWLTPQMDRLFLDSSRERRKFFDRLIFAFDPGHAGRVVRYENALLQRSKILRDAQQKNRSPDTAWLDGLEAQLAEAGVAIAAVRQSFIAKLQAACEKAGESVFPMARLSLRGTVEELLLQVSAIEVEDMMRYQLLQSRSQDAITGGAASGPHKSDLLVQYAAKTMPAGQCSTGEQKALLIGIVLAHARLIAAERDVVPLLLLDEVAAHLDEGRRAALYGILKDLGGQVWLTGTDAGLFDAVRGKAQFMEVAGGVVAVKNQVYAF